MGRNPPISSSIATQWMCIFRMCIFHVLNHVENMKDNSRFVDMFPTDLPVGFDRLLRGTLTD